MSLAKEIIAGFHGEAAAEKAAAEFQRVFRDHEAPSEVPVFKVSSGTYKLLTLLAHVGLASSRSEAERLVRGKAVEIDGQIVDAMNKTLTLHPGESVLLRAGKKKFMSVLVE
jgi:tyrosyl-tRNA synthetase